MNSLETRNLNKAFGKLVVADNVSLALPQGARHALIGPNGAGKTTLINLITGALRPDTGSVQLNGEDITSLLPDARVKRGLGRTFQINTLFPQLTPLESATMAICERDALSGHWLSPLAIAVRPSRLCASLMRTSGRPLLMRCIKPRLISIA